MHTAIPEKNNPEEANIVAGINSQNICPHSLRLPLNLLTFHTFESHFLLCSPTVILHIPQLCCLSGRFTFNNGMAEP